jgi:hypothetical protein
MKALKAEQSLMQKVPVECFQMSNIEDDAMALRDRAVIHGLRPDDVEKGIALMARIGDSP